MKTYNKNLSLLSILGLTLLLISPAGNAASWSYKGDTGPDYWGSLDPAYATCGTGSKQSPIDINRSHEVDLPRLKLRYGKTPLVITNNGHTIQVDYAPGSTLRIGRSTYNLLQFHFHTPSEHTLQGAPTGLEAHFVHADDQGNLAVIGIMMVEGKENKFLKPIWSHMPEYKGKVIVDGANLKGIRAFPKARDYYTYAGSLTTPPCTEGVRWIVLKETMTLSHAQIKAFEKVVHGHNARPTQPLNARRVKHSD